MQVALIGLPGTGVKTIFSAVTGLTESAGAYTGGGAFYRVAVLKVPDPRLDFISEVFKPAKTTQATVELVEFPELFGRTVEAQLLAKVREADALALVLRSFQSMRAPHPLGSVDPVRDLNSLLGDLLVADLQIVESRLDRLRSSLQKRPNEEEALEKEVLERCREFLEQSRPLREIKMAPEQLRQLRGFGFLTLKPVLLLLNIDEDQIGREKELMASLGQPGYGIRALCGDIEAELSGMSPEERTEFMDEFGIRELAAPVMIAAAYQTLDLVTFYTYSGDECRAWNLRQGETALDAAAKVHTDLARGFIRAEVVGFEDFRQHGDLKNVKAKGKLRLEGKDYVVSDGDIILIRHSS